MIWDDSKEGIDELIKSLNDSEPVVMPTETVYGLASKIDDLESLRKIFLYKKRPFFDPLIVHIYNKKQLSLLSHFESPVVDKLMDAFWPGPLTLVLPKHNSVSELITSGLDSVGVRMPKHPLALKLLEKINVPLAAPSANLFGQTSPTTAQHVEKDFPNLRILDGGPCDIGIESTVLKIRPLSNNRVALSILRKGSITQSMINQILLGATTDMLTHLPTNFKSDFEWDNIKDVKHSPGHMKHHYMPKIPIVFFNQPTDVEQFLPTIQSDFQQLSDKIEYVTIIKPTAPIERFEKLNFSSEAPIACRELYGKLKLVSHTDAQILIFEKKPYMTGELWEAFLERLTKASSLYY